MEAVLLVDKDMVPGKGLTLLVNLLVETRPDHVKEPEKFGTVFYLMNELGYLLDWEIDGTGQVFFEVIEELAVF